MRTFLTLSTVILALVFSTLTRAADMTYEKHIQAYVAVQKKLAADDLKEASLAAKSLQDALAKDKALKISNELKVNLEKIIQAKTLDAARTAFKDVSKTFVTWAEKAKPKGLEVVYCPMAGAKWVQDEGGVMNPYYGKDMLSCGEKIK